MFALAWLLVQAKPQPEAAIVNEVGSFRRLHAAGHRDRQAGQAEISDQLASHRLRGGRALAVDFFSGGQARAPL